MDIRLELRRALNALSQNNTIAVNRQRRPSRFQQLTTGNTQPETGNQKSGTRNQTPTVRTHYVILIVAYCGAIFWLSSQPEPPAPDLTFPGADKAAHALIYGGLAGLTSTGIRRSRKWSDPRLLRYGPLVFAVFYGLSDEVHQLFVPKRSFSLLDLAADALGAALVQWVLCLWVWRPSPLRQPERE